MRRLRLRQLITGNLQLQLRTTVLTALRRLRLRVLRLPRRRPIRLRRVPILRRSSNGGR